MIDEPVIMRQFEDRLAPGAAALAYASPCHRVFYVVEGAVRIDADAGGDLSSNQAAHTNGRATATAGAAGARLWRFEVLRAPAPDDGLVEAPGVVCEAKLSAQTVLPEADAYLIRCDRADFPLGSQTPKHTHQGPGIRSLLRGEIHAEIGGKKAVYRAGEAWFERGPDPVVGRSSQTLETGFVRVMILPRRLLGQSSFQYYDEAERQKPRAQNFQIFIDEPIEL